MIININENHIYFYHDYTFMIFDIKAMKCGLDIIGYCWPAGKIPYVRMCKEDNVDIIKKDTSYYKILVQELIDSCKNIQIMKNI